MSFKKEVGQLRVIAGKWRRRKITFPAVQGLRPTPDRIRETLFNWLQPYIEGARCLDLFAGSGALGIEALSRGAAEAVMIEQHPAVFTHLRGQLQALGVTAPRVSLIHSDALSYLRGTARPFDIVFVDPPFRTALAIASCRLLEQGGWLANHALIYLETEWTVEPACIPDRWQILHRRRAGNVAYCLAAA